MALSEIEKLERRYAENPHGLTFAPLAEVHRKNGDTPRALELLRPGLELHPNYIPASIVLGRCHIDLGDLSAAERAFTHVLGLDGENVIALKALADINERLRRYDVAERWLNHLLSVDRSNEDARLQLERIEAARRQAPAAEPVAAGESVVAAEAAAAEPAGAQAAVTVAAAPDPAPAVDEPTLLAAHDATVAPEPPGTASPNDLPLEPAVVPLDGLEPRPDRRDEPSATAGAEAEPGADAAEPGADLVGWVSDSGVPDSAGLAPLALDELTPPPEPIAAVEGLVPSEEIGLEAEIERAEGVAARDAETVRGDPTGLGLEKAEDLVLRPAEQTKFQVPDASLELAAASLAASPPADPGPILGEAPLARGPVADAEPVEPEALQAEPVEAEPVAVDPLAGLEVVSAAEARAGAEPSGAAPAEAGAFAAGASAATPGTSAAEPAASPELLLPEPEPDLPAEAEAAPLVVTETMAELLIAQGYTADALRIYRELERRSGGGERLRSKVAELEARLAPTTPRSYLARDTGGQSVSAFFAALLAARPPAAAPPPPISAAPASGSASAEITGAPTRPASDALSLSAVFGEEPPPVIPAVPAGPGPQPDGVSFEEFFGGSGPAGPRAPGRPPEVRDDDLDQFHAWLQNLKR